MNGRRFPSWIRSRSRPAFTLIELIAVLSLSSFVLVSVAVAISSLNRVSRTIREEIPTDENLVRLGLQFRTDAHDATAVDTESGQDGVETLEMKFNGGNEVSYHTGPRRVVRIFKKDGQQVRREQFLLQPGSEIVWKIDAEKNLVSLVSSRHRSRIPESSDDVQAQTITAAIGINAAIDSPSQDDES